MGNLGFGGYRITNRSKEHKQALILAIQKGIKLIDTSSNYTDGESEILIGEVLKELNLLESQNRPILVTKAGYIQGKNIEVLEALHAKGLAHNDLVQMTPDLMHSIHPDFLASQLEMSLKRLQVKCIDTFLLHNPEYFYSVHQEEGNIVEYSRRIQKAFEFLEEKVKDGKIKNYGVSSNTLAKNPNGENPTSLSMLLNAARKVGEDNHFKVIQFPLNLLEIDALERYQENNMNLIEMAHAHGLVVISNRPFNVIKESGELVRLCEYDHFDLVNFDENKAHEHFKYCMDIIQEKWNSLRESEDENLEDVDLISQFKNLYAKLPTNDAVDQVYFAHIFPFLASLWGGSGLNKEEAKPFYELLDYSHKFARLHMTNKAKSFSKQAIELGLLPDSNSPLSIKAVNAYFSYGVDFVLVGMRKSKYVEELSELIS